MNDIQYLNFAKGNASITVGAAEETVCIYIRDQEKKDRRVEQLVLFKQATTERWSVDFLTTPL